MVLGKCLSCSCGVDIERNLLAAIKLVSEVSTVPYAASLGCNIIILFLRLGQVAEELKRFNSHD